LIFHLFLVKLATQLGPRLSAERTKNGMVRQWRCRRT